MLHITLLFCQIVLYILTGYQVLIIVYLNQLLGARHTHISYHNTLQNLKIAIVFFSMN